MAFKQKIILPKKGLVKRKLQQLEKRLGGGKTVTVGVPSDAGDYPDGTSTAMVAAVHEFGAKIPVTDKMRGFFLATGSPLKATTTHIQIPERSFLRSTMREQQTKYVKFLRKNLVAVLTGRLKAEEAAARLGQIASDDVKDKIYEISSPPNSDMTVKKKGSSNPLVDTGHLARSITFEVQDA